MLLKNWKSILLGVLVLMSLFVLWYLYDDNQNLQRKLAESKLAVELCNSDYENLQDSVWILQTELDDLKESNKDLEDRVEQSKEVIHVINNDREILLQKLAKEKVPEQCDDILSWIVDRVQEIE